MNNANLIKRKYKIKLCDSPQNNWFSLNCQDHERQKLFKDMKKMDNLGIYFAIKDIIGKTSEIRIRFHKVTVL